MNIQKININDINTENRLWSIDESVVASLVESIKVIGLKSLPSIRYENNTPILIAGNHRLEACKILGMYEIDVIVDDVDENHALIHEIDENLSRRAVHYTERGYQLNERKKAYEKIFGAQLSSKASFERYFNDVEAIVKKGRKTSKYDYALFSSEELNFDYIKDRAINNQMEDLFGVCIDKNGHETVKKLEPEDIAMVKKLYPILKKINENFEGVSDFKSDVHNKLNLACSAIANDLVLGERLTPEDMNIIKSSNIDKNLALKMAKGDNKEDYINLIKENISNKDSKKSPNTFLKKIISNATKDSVDKLGKKDGNFIFEKTSEILNDTIQYNLENGFDRFDTTNLSEKSNVDLALDTHKDCSSFENKIEKVAELFEIDRCKIESSISENTLHLIINLKEN